MIVQSRNDVAAIYGTGFKSPVTRQASPAATAGSADRVSISAAAQALLANTQSPTQEQSTQQQVQQRIDAIKAKPGAERTAEDTDYLLKNDKRYAQLQDKMKASGMTDGFDALTADELDYMQKAGGFVNTMATLSPQEKALYDKLVGQGNHAAAHGLALIAMARTGMGGQQVVLPDGKTFDPANTEVTANNIRSLLKYMFVDPSGQAGRQLEALASYLDTQVT